MMQLRAAAAVVIVLALPACSDMAMNGHGNLLAAAPMLRPEARGDVPAPSAARDDDEAPDVVSVSLRAGPAQVAYLDGRPASVWAYNGTIPGPTIEAHVGDRVRVHFTNDLPEPTTIHWHGVRVPHDMDGAARLLKPIAPGASFDYEFVVPDAGLFWYHPHVRSDVQVNKGLYGAILVRDPAEPALGVAAERVLVLDDVRVDPESGQTDERVSMRDEMMGREGNLLLINGASANRTMSVGQGERLRLRIVNAANARFFRLTLSGAAMIQVGGDGGLLPAPREVSAVMLVPGERVDVVIRVDGAATLKASSFERAHGAGSSEEMALVALVPAPSTAVPAPALPVALREIPTLIASDVRQVVKLSERMAHRGWQFTINGRTFPDVPLLSAAVGSQQLWSVQNDSDMDHPLHIHGFFFQKRGVPEWKDTINIPSRSTMELVVDFAARPGAIGDWMYHCHILEHAEGGMMGEIHVR